MKTKPTNVSFNRDPIFSDFLSKRYVWKVDSWHVRHVYLKANGYSNSLAEEYYIHEKSN